MTHDIAGRCEFSTERLSVAEWHDLAERRALQLTDVVRAVLTQATTRALPPEWRGDFDEARAVRWIEARDAESPTLLAVDTESGGPVGLVILFEAVLPGTADRVDLRLGYVLAETAWGRGLATELVRGLVDWARSAPSIESLTAGVADGNETSARVLVKAGFALSGRAGSERVYSLTLGQKK